MDHFENIKAWPFVEAKKLLEKIDKIEDNEPVVFETGYGPSGLPHIGTFGEVARTIMVKNAFEEITNNSKKTKLICFSDDMDALRKVPDNIPNQAEISRHLGKPLTEVPDPFGEYASFGEHNNNKLKSFLDQFKFGGFKLGFWFAQQGSIFFFVILIFVYVHLLNKLDDKYKKNKQ